MYFNGYLLCISCVFWMNETQNTCTVFPRTLVLVLVRNGPPSRPEETERYFPPATADSKPDRQERTRVGSVSACILALFSPPGQWRSVNARTAPRLDQKLCGRHDRPVQSLSPLSLSFFVSRRRRRLGGFCTGRVRSSPADQPLHAGGFARISFPHLYGSGCKRPHDTLA